MARLGRAQLKSFIAPVRARNADAYLQGNVCSFQITTSGTISFPIPAYFYTGETSFKITTAGQIVKYQDLTGLVEWRIGTTVGQAYPLGLLLAITDPTRGLTYQLDRSLTVGSTAAPTFAPKTVGKLTTLPVTSTPSVNKGLSWLLTRTITTTPVIAKRVNRVLSTAAATVATTLVPMKVFLKTITVTVVSSPIITRVTNKAFSVNATAALTYTRLVGASRTVGATVSTSIRKSIPKTLSIAATTAITIGKEIQAQIIYQAITVVSNVTAGIQMRVYKTISRSVFMSTVISKLAPNSYVARRARKVRGGLGGSRGTSF